MKCSVKNCPNTTHDNPDKVSFHGFPTNVEVLHKWVTFTGRNNFMPKLSSTICGAHFDDDAYISKPKNLKFRAVPTLQVAPRVSTSRGIKVAKFAMDVHTNSSEEKDPLACDSNVDNSKYNPPSDSLNVSASPELSEEPSSSTSLFAPPGDAPVTSESKPDITPTVPPIKLVDMDKLLKKKSPFEQEATNAVSSSNNQEEDLPNKPDTHSSQSHENQPLQTSKQESTIDCSNSQVSDAFQKTTVSKILECLRVILPMKFDLTKLIPNEKIALLVLRYLKVENTKEFNDMVRFNLKIIVDTAKIKVTEFGDEIKHPYHKIPDDNLEMALRKCLPNSFSMSDVSNDLLNCLCLIMEQGVFSDGYHILRRRIRKYTREGLMFNEIITQTSESTAPKVKTDNSKKPSNKRKRSMVGDTGELAYQEKSNINGCESKKKTGPILKDALSEKSCSNGNSQTEKLNTFNSDNTQPKTNQTIAKSCTASEASQSKSQDSERTKLHSTNESGSKALSKEESLSQPHSIDNLESILTYLKNQQCSAKDALTSFRLMFYLCKFLQVKCNQPNLQRVKSALRYIAERKISHNSVKSKSKLLPRKALFEPSTRDSFDDGKLNMRPIVKLRNLTHYVKDHFVFMNTQKLNHKTGYYSQIIPTVSQSTPGKLQRYANDYIEKITNEEYKTFRKIVVKKCGGKFVGRIKYKNITPGCSVFVKDYRNAAMGWLKGKVTSTISHLSYLVQLDNGESLQCVLDQIRPVPDQETLSPGLRTPRAVKPKQMFDL